MNRGNFSTWISVGVLSTIVCITTEGVAFAQSRNGTKQDHRRGDGNRDGKDTVVGAMWELTATKAGSNEQVKFRYRIADLKIYDLKTNEQIGVATSNHGKNVKGGGEVTFFKNSPFPSKFPIKFQKLSHWKGVYKDDKTTWAIKLACLDR